MEGVLFVDLHGVLVPEGRLADEELVDKDAERPPVYCRAVACRLLVSTRSSVSVRRTCVSDDFWCEILWRAA